jgi:hypothetical protein
VRGSPTAAFLVAGKRAAAREEATSRPPRCLRSVGVRLTALLLAVAASACGGGRPAAPDAAPGRQLNPEEEYVAFLNRRAWAPAGPQSEEPRYRRYCDDDRHCPARHVCLAPHGQHSDGLAECHRYCQADSECRADEVCVCEAPGCAVPYQLYWRGTNYCAEDENGGLRLYGRLLRWREATKCE